MLGVSELHQNFVIHRDIKPENIVLTHVPGNLFREFQRYVILGGRCIVQNRFVLLYAVPHSISHRKF